MTEHNQAPFVQPENRAGSGPEGPTAGSPAATSASWLGTAESPTQESPTQESQMQGSRVPEATAPDGWSTSNPPYSSPAAAPYYWAPSNAPSNGAYDGPAHAAQWPAGASGAPWVAAPYLPQPAAQGSRPQHHRGLRTSLALLLVAAGVGVGVVAGRETQHNSSLGVSTTQVDSGAGAAGSGAGATDSGAGSGTGSSSGNGSGTGTGTGSGTGPGTGSGTGTGSGDGSNTAPGGGWGWGAGGPGGVPGGVPSGIPGGGTPGGQTGGTETPRVKATAAQQVGVVNINTVLKYQSASAAGTGMVLSSDGEILTNNHVVNGATSITVTVVSTGKTYAATVVGTDARDDIAVIKLQNASGLSTAKLATTAAVKTGDKVTGVGNAGGAGGVPSAATGKVTALNQSITAADEGGAHAEKLTGLIQNDADIVAGDSGGPLYNAGGRIIGINTAGASTNQYSAQDVSYAIPISTAVSIADQIEQGNASAKIHIGSTAFLGISVATASGGSGSSVTGATIGDVVAAGPAARAGIVAGDVITSIGGHRVTSATSLSSVMDGYHGGDKLRVEWTTATGKSKHATITTIAGPAK